MNKFKVIKFVRNRKNMINKSTLAAVKSFCFFKTLSASCNAFLLLPLSSCSKSTQNKKKIQKHYAYSKASLSAKKPCLKK